MIVSRKIYWSFAVLAIVSGGCLSQTKAAEKYSATVNDGTAKVIKPGKPRIAAEPREEFLENIMPAPAARSFATEQAVRPPKKLSARISDHGPRRELDRRLVELETARIEKQKTTETEQEPMRGETQEADPDLNLPNDGGGIDLASEDAGKGANAHSNANDDEIANTDTTTHTDAAAAAPGVIMGGQAQTGHSAIKERESEKSLARTEVDKARLTASEFDEVPDNRISELSQRLKYTNEILKRWGRAYDYRTTTLKEFKRIVSELKRSDENRKVVN